MTQRGTKCENNKLEFYFPFTPVFSTFPPLEPSASPLNLQSINTTFNSILATWNEVPAADRNGIIVSYTVRYQAIGGDNVNAQINTKTVEFSTKWVNLAGLKEDTVYRISVLASTVKGDGKYSEPIFVRTNRQESKNIIVTSYHHSA